METSPQNNLPTFCCFRGEAVAFSVRIDDERASVTVMETDGDTCTVMATQAQLKVIMAGMMSHKCGFNPGPVATWIVDDQTDELYSVEGAV